MTLSRTQQKLLRAAFSAKFAADMSAWGQLGDDQLMDVVCAVLPNDSQLWADGQVYLIQYVERAITTFND